MCHEVTLTEQVRSVISCHYMTTPIQIPLYRTRYAASWARIGASWRACAAGLHFPDLIAKAKAEAARAFEQARLCNQGGAR